MTKISDLMTRNVQTVRPDDPILQAARKMRDCDCGSMPVCDASGALVGIVTDRDITIRATAEGHDPLRTPVRDVMTQEVVSCRPDDTLDHAAELMRQRQVRRIPVVDEGNRIVGLLPIGKLSRVEPETEAGKLIKDVSEPTQKPTA